MKFGIVIAMQSEADMLLANLKNENFAKISHQKFYSGKLHGKEAVICVAGIGKVNAATGTAVLILQFGCTQIFNCGIIGGSAKHFQIGDIVCIDSAVHGDFDTSAIGDQIGYVSGPDCIKFPLDISQAEFFRRVYGDKCKIATISSADSFTHSAKAVERAYNLFKATCFDMEVAAIAQVCKIFGVKLNSIKVVCDYADENAGESFKISISDCCKLVQEVSLDYIKIYLNQK